MYFSVLKRKILNKHTDYLSRVNNLTVFNVLEHNLGNSSNSSDVAQVNNLFNDIGLNI